MAEKPCSVLDTHNVDNFSSSAESLTEEKSNIQETGSVGGAKCVQAEDTKQKNVGAHSNTANSHVHPHDKCEEKRHSGNISNPKLNRCDSISSSDSDEGKPHIHSKLRPDEVNSQTPNKRKPSDKDSPTLTQKKAKSDVSPNTQSDMYYKNKNKSDKEFYRDSVSTPKSSGPKNDSGFFSDVSFTTTPRSTTPRSKDQIKISYSGDRGISGMIPVDERCTVASVLEKLQNEINTRYSNKLKGNSLQFLWGEGENYSEIPKEKGYENIMESNYTSFYIKIIS